MNLRSSPRPAALALTLALLLALAAGGCGGGGEETDRPAANPANPYAPGGEAESEAPKGASLVLRQIYRQFPPPEPDPAVKASAAAIRAGTKACAGRTPLEVEQLYYQEAIEAGGLEAGSDKAEMIAETGRYEENAARDSSFTAGQLAAGAYEATLPEATAPYGYQGCVYALALRLKRELAPKNSR